MGANRALIGVTESRAWRSAVIAALLVASGASGQIQWKNPGQAARGGALPAGQDGLARRMNGLVAGREADLGRRRVVVEFGRPVTEAERGELAAAGVELLSALGPGAFFASLDRGALDAGRAARAAPMRSVEAVRTDWKLHPDLAAGRMHEWMVVGADRPEPGAKPDEADPVVAVYAVLHRDADPVREGVRAVERAGGRVVSVVSAVNTLVVELPWSAVTALAEADAVMYVEPPLPRLDEVNSFTRALTGVNTVQAPPYGLSGAGVTVLVYDGGKVFAHPDFGSRLTIGTSDTAPVSGHATHVAGTVAGDGLQSSGTNRGMAPAAQIVSYGFETEGGAGFLYTDPGDIEADYTEAITLYGADLSNNSIGSNTAPNGFPCEWEGDYGATSALIDAIARGALGQPFRIVWANGNERSGTARCGNAYRTTAPPACAKNHIAVGAVNSDNDAITSFTSWGPADDGRMKPDIVAPGCKSTGGIVSCANGGFYTTLCGTSMASPAVSGICALILEDFRAQFPSLPDPRNSTLKALLAHTAVDLDAPGPDYKSGYGSVRAPAAIEQLRTGSFGEHDLSQDDVWAAAIVVPPGLPALKVTVAWDDWPATPNVVNALVNDLDLVLISPTGARAYPWTLGGLADPSAPAARTEANKIDNIEQVFVESPEPGAWRVEVRGFNVPEGPQPFSVVASPDLVSCADEGFVALDRLTYSCDDLVVISVVDCGPNADPMAIDSVQVTVSSTSDQPGVPLVLSETGPDTAQFVGSILVRDQVAGASILVGEGDTITAAYFDADPDGAGAPGVNRFATGLVDCTAAVVSNVSVTDVLSGDAVVRFETSEPARASVRLGESCAGLVQTVADPLPRTVHAIPLTGLSESTGYRLAIDTTDLAGNPATDDNAGQCYGFTTLDRVDYFTQQFAGDNDLSFTTVTFTPNGSADFYGACAEPASALPVDPAGHTPMNLPDDLPFEAVDLELAVVQLYGVQYETVHISPNGYLVFGLLDDIRSESITLHFTRPRVAALTDDLDPSAGGSTSYAQLGDRFVVTFLGVPQYGVGDENTFQYELFFDGRIRVTWLEIEATDGLAGLSDGNGVPFDFHQSDLSAESSGCTEMPPSAAPVFAATDFAQAVEVHLLAADDGLPAPASLEHVILSLPLHGTLIDPGAGPVLSVPHTLASAGDSVVYAPRGVYRGDDSFDYLGRDGGSAPSGGNSPAATVTVSVGGPIAAAEFLTDDTDPMWARDAGWEFGPPLGLGGAAAAGPGVGPPDPSSAFTGANVLGFNLAGNFPNAMPPRYLTTGVLDCSGLSNVTLTYRRWLGVDEVVYDRAGIDISVNGVNWQEVWLNPFDGQTLDSEWVSVSHDITALAAGQPAVRLRWVMGPTNAAYTFSGWNLDDILLTTLVDLDACEGDANFDRVVDFADVVMVLGEWGRQGATRREGDANNDQLVDFADVVSVLGAWGDECPLPRIPASGRGAGAGSVRAQGGLHRAEDR